MLLTDAQIYVARIYGGTNNSTILAQALDAIKSTMELWQRKHNWHFLLQDTSQTFAVVSSSAASVTLTTIVTNGFKNVLVGMTITGTNIPAGTTVASIESNLSLTMSAAATGTISAASITFGGTIPIRTGVDTYKLPTRFWKPYSCRLTTNSKRPLQYVQQNFADAVSFDQTIPGQVEAYTIYNANDLDTSGTQQSFMKVINIPSQNDTAILKFYRPFDPTRTTLDVPDGYVYTFLDCAQIKLLLIKDSQNPRIPALMIQMYGSHDQRGEFQAAVAADKEEGGEDQLDEFKSPHEMARRGLGFDGVFYPRGDY
jgi:hypothetical protein